MLDEYISREAALMKLMQDGCSAKNLQSISDMPAADVAEVVRCKGCKFEGKYLGGGLYCKHDKGLLAPKPDDFCSYGERREE